MRLVAAVLPVLTAPRAVEDGRRHRVRGPARRQGRKTSWCTRLGRMGTQAVSYAGRVRARNEASILPCIPACLSSRVPCVRGKVPEGNGVVIAREMDWMCESVQLALGLALTLALSRALSLLQSGRRAGRWQDSPVFEAEHHRVLAVLLVQVVLLVCTLQVNQSRVDIEMEARRAPDRLTRMIMNCSNCHRCKRMYPPTVRRLWLAPVSHSRSFSDLDPGRRCPARSQRW